MAQKIVYNPRAPVDGAPKLKLSSIHNALRKRPSSAHKLFGELYYLIRTEPGDNWALWVDFYWRKSWVETRDASSTVLAALALSTDITGSIFLNSSTGRRAKR